MTDPDLPEIIVPADDVAVRAQPTAGQPRFPERAEKVWVVAAHDDGSVVVLEIPRPEGITIETEREMREGSQGWNPWRLNPWDVVAEPGPWKLQVTIDGFDEDKHPNEPRPTPLFAIRIYPPGAWKP